MSKTARRQMLSSVEDSQTLFARMEHEMAEGYFEVEITGMSFRRLVAAYTVLVRGAWSHTLGSVRSLLRPNPALEG